MPMCESHKENGSTAEEQARVFAKMHPTAGMYAMPPVTEEEEAPPKFGERMKEIAALTIAMYGILWKPVVCLLAGTGIAYLLIRLLIRS